MNPVSAISLLERSASAGTWSWELGTRRLRGSPGLSAVLGFEDATTLPSLDRCLDRLTPESRAQLADAIGRCRQVGQPWDLEVRLRGGRHLRAVGEARIDHGEIVAVQGVFVDIDVQRRAQIHSEELDRRYRAIDGSLFVFCASVNPDGALLEASEASLAFCGESAEDLVGQRLWLTPWWTYSGEVQMQLHAGIMCAAAGESVRYEVEIMGLEGAVAIDLTIRPCIEADGRIERLIVQGQDISDRRRIATALRHSEARFRTLFDRSPVGTAMAGLDGRVVAANRALTAVLGYSRIELLAGMNLQQITHADDLDAELDPLHRLLSGASDGYRIERRLRHRNGRYVHVQLDVSLVRDEQGEPQQLLLHVQDLESRLHTPQAAPVDQRARA